MRSSSSGDSSEKSGTRRSSALAELVSSPMPRLSRRGAVGCQRGGTGREKRLGEEEDRRRRRPRAFVATLTAHIAVNVAANSARGRFRTLPPYRRITPKSSDTSLARPIQPHQRRAPQGRSGSPYGLSL